MIRYFCLHGRTYSPPLDHIQAEEETRRRRAEGDPIVLAYDKVCAEHSARLTEEVIERSPLLMRLRDYAASHGQGEKK
jgi:hypothetical protein